MLEKDKTGLARQVERQADGNREAAHLELFDIVSNLTLTTQSSEEILERYGYSTSYSNDLERLANTSEWNW